MTLPDEIDTIVVPLDGSTDAAYALPVAEWLAQTLDASVHVVSAVASVDEGPDRAATLGSIQLDGLKTTTEVVVDLDAAAAIHRTVERLGRAIACMSSHGRSRSAALLGSVTTEVVRRGRDPVVVVGPNVEGPPPLPGVVACVDDTPAASSLVAVASRWSAMLGQPLEVLTVAEPVPDPVKPGASHHRRFGPEDPESFLRQLVGDAGTTTVVWDPISPAEGVSLHLQEHPAAIVVLSSHARTGPSRLAFGSVAASIVHASRIPAVIVPRTEVANGE